MATKTWKSKWLQPKWEKKLKEFSIGGRLDHCHLSIWNELIHVIAGSRTMFLDLTEEGRHHSTRECRSVFDEGTKTVLLECMLLVATILLF